MANPIKNPACDAVIRFARISFLLLGIASSVFAAARFAASYSPNLLSASLPGAWIAIQIIIAVVWLLSRDKPHGNRQLGGDSSPYAPPLPLVKEGDPETPLDRKPSSDIWNYIAHSPGLPESVPATPAPALDSGEPPPEQSFHAPCLAADSLLEIERSKKPPPPEREAGPTEGEGDANERSSMEATWRAILDVGAAPTRRVLRKSDTWEGSPRVEAPATATAPVAGRELRKSATFRESGWRGREALVVSGEELLGRVEAFIEMHYDRLRLQRQESEQRRFMEIGNHVY